MTEIEDLVFWVITVREKRNLKASFVDVWGWLWLSLSLLLHFFTLASKSKQINPPSNHLHLHYNTLQVFDLILISSPCFHHTQHISWSWWWSGGRAWHKDDLHILMKTSSPYNTISTAVEKYISDWILNQFKHNEFLNLNSCQFKFLLKMLYKWSECLFFLN